MIKKRCVNELCAELTDVPTMGLCPSCWLAAKFGFTWGAWLAVVVGLIVGFWRG